MTFRSVESLLVAIVPYNITLFRFYRSCTLCQCFTLYLGHHDLPFHLALIGCLSHPDVAIREAAVWSLVLGSILRIILWVTFTFWLESLVLWAQHLISHGS